MRHLSFVLVLFLFVTLLLPGRVKAQITSEMLEVNAVDMTVRSRSNDTLYDKVKGFKAIMVGGVLGTKEPPEFFLGIVKSLIKNGKKVIAGVELPADGVDFKENWTLESLKKAHAFTTHTRDGRQSIAWAEMMVELQKTGAEIVCFDLTMEVKRELRSHRDSLMFLYLNEQLAKDTNKVFVSITANVVNRMVPFNKLKTMGCYLKDDDRSVLKGKPILSLNFLYNDGTAHNWMSNGYKVRNIEGNAGVYAYAAPYENYLLVYPVQDGYNGLIFSSTITASGPLVEVK